MKICIPTTNDLGLDARVHAHFGSAPFFAIADTDGDAVAMIENQSRDHAHGQCKPVDHIDSDAIDAVVCLGMGRRALASLEHTGVGVYVVDGDTVRDVLSAARSGRMKRLTLDEACGGGRSPHRAATDGD